MKKKKLIEAIERLLGCTDLNLDELDKTSEKAIRFAEKVLKKAREENERKI